ncbi:MAG: hypothetical protein BGP05_09690 [Rhizobiales bacterium 62-47]|nr:hypothetical protein [Hyphomicrobiales bacterium]OJY14142.1 MAG: hypothetical protein BGP05_09690 [Rhizobiales bacterium 62-47]
MVSKKRGLVPRFFVASNFACGTYLLRAKAHCRIAAGFIVGEAAPVLGYGMVPDRKDICARIVLDDRSRLPWRFFGRLTTTALAA